MSRRLARWIAWSIVAAYFGLAAAGVALQALAGRTYANFPLSLVATVLLVMSLWPITGALIISRHPRHPVGWLLCAGIAFTGLDLFAVGYAFYDLEVFTGSLPGFIAAVMWIKTTGYPSLTAFALTLLVFPNGRLPSRAWRALAWATVAALPVVLIVPVLQPGPLDPFGGFMDHSPLAVSAAAWAVLQPLVWIALTVVALGNVAGVAALVVRLRRGHGEERQQVKWLLAPAALNAFAIPSLLLALELRQTLLAYVAAGLALFAFTGMVVAVAFAVFKYRLYDVDLILNRALVYGTLTGVLALAYLGSVVVLQSLLRTLTGQAQAEWVTALSTLATAALFAPARRRIQRFIDRCFYRSRYDAAKTLAQFSTWCQREVDLQAVESRLLAAVDETMQPAHVSLWRPGVSPRGGSQVVPGPRE
jgi:hypothetical protein